MFYGDISCEGIGIPYSFSVQIFIMFKELVVLIIHIIEIGLQVNWTLMIAATLVFLPIGPMITVVHAKNATNKGQI